LPGQHRANLIWCGHYPEQLVGALGERFYAGGLRVFGLLLLWPEHAGARYSRTFCDAVDGGAVTIVPCRYLWWRYTSTLNWDQPVDLACGLALQATETYSANDAAVTGAMDQDRVERPHFSRKLTMPRTTFSAGIFRVHSLRDHWASLKSTPSVAPDRSGWEAKPVTKAHSELRGRLIADAQCYLHDCLRGRLQ
jgi:hypothetical protein